MESRPKKPAGRPSLQEAKANRRALLETALDEFALMGYEGASVRVIADKAGLSTRTIYNHYPDKVSLFAACLELPLASLSMDIGQKGDDLYKRLHGFALSTQQQLSTRRSMRLTQIFYRDSIGFPEIAELSRRTFQRNQIAPVKSILRDEGFDEGLAQELAAHFVALALGKLQRRLICDEPPMTSAEMQVQADVTVTLFLKGLSAVTRSAGEAR